jgi:hypothetical protein
MVDPEGAAGFAGLPETTEDLARTRGFDSLAGNVA